MGIEQGIYTPSALEIVLLCVHAPRGLFRVRFLPHPPPLSDGNLHPAALLRMRGNYFGPYLSTFACATEVQHNNENPTTSFPEPTELWSNQFPDSKILGVPVSRRMRALV